MSINAQPDRLFPFRFSTSSVGDPLDISPLAAPFSSRFSTASFYLLTVHRSSIATSAIAANLELRILGQGNLRAPQSLSSLAVDEASVQVLY